MMRFSVCITVLYFIFMGLIVSCSNRDSGARTYLEAAESAYRAGDFPLAKLKIDSIAMLFPNALNERRAGFSLLQQVRMAENVRNIAFSDSMLTENYAILNQKLPLFDFVLDTENQDLAMYYPRAYLPSVSLNRSGVRARVNEKGVLFIESVVVGNNIRHNQIRASVRDGSFAETLPVTSDGLNARFSTIDNSFEIVTYSGSTENGFAEFIETFRNEQITIQFIGSRNTTITLSNAEKQGIIQSLELSVLLTDIERLKFERDRSEVLIRYLESKN
jgi:hypothetical protein